MIKMLLIFSLMFSSFSARADDEGSSAPDSAAMQELIGKIARVREALKISASGSQACETPNASNCTFESYCGQLAGKTQDFYLYQDEDGRQIANEQMLFFVQVAETCARKPFPQAAVEDPFVYPEQLTNADKAGGPEKLKKNLERYNKELKRVSGIFAETQARVIKVLESRKNKNNAAGINNMIKRIKMTTIKTPKLGDGISNLSAEGCESPNAFYQYEKTSLTVCPQLFNLPDAALFSAIAHELGHAIDPCAMALSYSKKGQDFEPDFPEFMHGKGLNKRAEIAAFPPSKNPMASVIACLQQPSSIGVTIPSQKQLLSKIDQEENNLRKEVSERDEKAELSEVVLANFEDSRKIIKDNYETYKGCSTFTDNGHLQEAWSDWVASQALADKVSDFQDSQKAKKYAFASQAFFFSRECENVAQASLEKVKAETQSQCSYFNKVEEKLAERRSKGGDEDREHPAPSRRLNRLIYVQPEIQKALGCKGSSENNGSECK